MIRSRRMAWMAILALGLCGPAAAGTLYRCVGGPGDPVNFASRPVAGMKCKALGYDSTPSRGSPAQAAPMAGPPVGTTTSGMKIAASAATPMAPAPSTVDSVAIPVPPGAPALSPDAAMLRQRAAIASANPAANAPLQVGRGGRVTQKTLYKYTDAAGIVHYEDEIHKPGGIKAEIKDSHTESCSDAIHCRETGYDTFFGHSNYSYANLIGPCYACGLLPGVNFGRLALNTTAYAAEISVAAHTYGVDEWLVRAIIHAESNFNPNALSNKGARGLMQLMPATAVRFGVANAFAAADNISGGVQYLSFLSRRYNGDVRLIAAAYNAGEHNVDRYGGVPPFAETMRYVDRVGTLAQRYRGGK